MAKKIKLQEADKFFIDNNPDMSVEDLSEKLNMRQSSIEKYRKENPPVPKPKPKLPPTPEQLNRERMNLGQNMVAMHGGMSEVGDEHSGKTFSGITASNRKEGQQQAHVTQARPEEVEEMDNDKILYRNRVYILLEDQIERIGVNRGNARHASSYEHVYIQENE